MSDRRPDPIPQPRIRTLGPPVPPVPPVPPRQTRGRAPRPRTSTVFRLAEIRRDVLGVATPAVLDDDLFTLGRDSALITRIQHRILESFGVSLPLHLVVEAPTLTHLAELVEQAMEDGIDGSPSLRPTSD